MQGRINSSNPDYDFRWFTDDAIKRNIKGRVRERLVGLYIEGFERDYEEAQEVFWEGIEGNDWCQLNVVFNNGRPIAMSSHSFILARDDSLLLENASVKSEHRQKGILSTMLLGSINTTLMVYPDVSKLYAQVEYEAPHLNFMQNQGFTPTKEWVVGVYPTEGYHLLVKKIR